VRLPFYNDLAADTQAGVIADIEAFVTPAVRG